MSQFELVFSTTLALTVLSGVAATLLVMVADTRSSARRRLVERLSFIAVLGASAIIALLQELGRN